jgi:hypothetical protein
MKACDGHYMNYLCDSIGFIPFERSPDYFVMLCRMCFQQEHTDCERARELAMRQVEDEMYRKHMEVREAHEILSTH